MAKKLDRIIVVDLEATCWDGEPPPGQKAEIIEIGVCTLDIASGERYKKASFLVRPQHSQVSDFCARLTTLTQAQLDQGGQPFAEAMEHLRQEYSPADRTWASFGDYDRVQLQRQCSEENVPYPFGRSHINIKNLLAVSLNLPYEISLTEALKRLRLPMEGTHHRGDDDAWSAAVVLFQLFQRIRQNS